MTDHSTRLRDQFADMIEATRLTGSGRLAEATDLIQRSLGGAMPEAPVPAPRRIEPPTLDLRAERVGEAPMKASKEATKEARRDAPAPGMARHGMPNQGTPLQGVPLQGVPIPEKLREAVGGVVRGLAPVLKGFKGLADGPGFAEMPGLKGFHGTPPMPGRQPPAPEDGAFTTRSFSGPAGSRDYRLFVPSRPQAGAGLVVMLHGCNQTADDFAVGTGMNRLAEQDGFYVAYPMQTGRANAQRCWNWFEPRDQHRGSGEAAIIAGLTQAVIAEYGIDPDRVYVAGLSAGGAAAANLARAYPELYAAVGVHSGLAASCARDVGSALMAMQMGAAGPGDLDLPAIVFHGDEDATVSPRNADQVLAQAGAAALRPTSESFAGSGHSYTRTRYADAGGRVRIESWRVRGAGHAWSGGDPAGSFTDRNGPDASRAMLDFFREHPRGA